MSLSCLLKAPWLALLHYTDNNLILWEEWNLWKKIVFFLNFLNSTIISTHDEEKRKEKVQTKIENQKHRNINQLHMFEFVWTTSLLVMFLDQSPCLIYLILPYYCESTHWIQNIKQANPKKKPKQQTLFPNQKHHPTFSHF